MYALHPARLLRGGNEQGKEDPQFSIHEKSAAAKQTNMQAIISDIDQIIQNGHGYASGGDVFFDVASMPAYGELSGRKKVFSCC